MSKIIVINLAKNNLVSTLILQHSDSNTACDNSIGSETGSHASIRRDRSFLSNSSSNPYPGITCLPVERHLL